MQKNAPPWKAKPWPETLPLDTRRCSGPLGDALGGARACFAVRGMILTDQQAAC